MKIWGRNELGGSVLIQGSKNTAMKYAVLPFLGKGKFVFENIPLITSVTNLLAISESQGARVEWIDKNNFSIDTTGVNKAKRIKADDFYFTSGGVLFIPLLASRFGEMVVEKHKTRNDYGGDTIGSRTIEMVKETLKQFGIGYKENDKEIMFFLESKKMFDVTIPRKSVTVTLFAIIAAMFKEGESVIRKRPEEAQVEDVIRFLQKAGAKIKIDKETIWIEGPGEIRGISYKNISDYNDFATWALIAVGTGSRLELDNVDLETMKVEPLLNLLDKWKVKKEIKNNKCVIDPQKIKFRPVDINAGQLPMFHTDWQPLLTPVLTKIEGISTIKDTFFDNRIGHCTELGKMGMKYEIIKNKYPTVKIFGPRKFRGAKVVAKDVRGGGALIIAALMADGETEIEGIEHIERGYENIKERLSKIGAKTI